MRWLFLIIGGVATAAMLGISMRVNLIVGYSLGQMLERAEVFGWVSIISDLWKAPGPIFFYRPLSRKAATGDHRRLRNLGRVLTLTPSR